MAFDESLAARVRDALDHTKGISEIKMFGGLCFLLHGNLLVGVWRDALIARLGADEADRSLRESYVRPFDGTGRPMRNWVLVESEGVEDDHAVREWVDRAMTFVRTLPKK